MNNSEIRIMKQKPQLTDEEIRSHMDFEKLLQLKNSTATKSNPGWLKFVYWSGTAVLVASIAYYIIRLQDNNLTPQNSPQASSSTRADSIGTSDQQPKPSDEKISVPDSSAGVGIQPSARNLKPRVKSESSKTQMPDSSRQRHLVQLTEAEPIAGYPDLYEYFNRELTYPAQITKDSIEGTVIVSFVIQEDGTPGEIKIANSLGELFDQESIRVIKNMPKWKAATVNGNPTATRLSIPLTFKILK